MFGSDVIDVGIGVSLLFLSVSLICTAVRETIEGVMKTRGMDLERGIRELLDDPKGLSTVTDFFNHPQIYSLFLGDYDANKLSQTQAAAPTNSDAAKTVMPWGDRRHLPSYIPANNFSTALLDLIVRGKVPYQPDDNPPQLASTITVDSLRASVNQLGSARLQRAVLVAIDLAAGDIATVKSNLEAWYNSTMDRVSGWYKRRTHVILFALGLSAAAFLNLDTITVVERLTHDKDLRAVAVAQAEKLQGKTADQMSHDGVTVVREQLDAIGLPIGWNGGWPAPQTRSVPLNHDQGHLIQSKPNSTGQVYELEYADAAKMAVGWLITAFAVTLGAPFWFDVLSKFMTVRSAMKPKGKAADKASTNPGKTGKGSTADPTAGAGAAPPYSPQQWKSDPQGPNGGTI